ncbi:MAG: cytochrome P450, partial [Steroidobacteraceae bacterium]
NAVEELLRRHGIVNSARRITKDYVFEGVQLRAGEMIQAPNLFFGLDQTVADDPLAVDFDRPQPKHAVFGNGPHVCPGQHLARRELTVFLEEWLPRIPEFTLQAESVPELKFGMVLGIASLHLTWPIATRA